MRALPLLCLLLPFRASAFCGIYVNEPGQTIENHASSVILANHDGTNTLTLAADFEGDASKFGLLVPIPQAIHAEDVRVADPQIFAYLDQYTQPRMVTYPQNWSEQDTDSDADADADADADTDRDEDYPVVVEDRFTVGAYDIAVLATEDSGALTGWLADNGFEAPEDRGGILQDYIDGGAHFMAARVSLDAASEGVAWLPPLQFSYPGEVRGLPIRIGTLSAAGEQELIVYLITDSADGKVVIDNYPEAHVPDECRFNAGTTLDSWYSEQLDTAFDGRAGWLLEYSIPVIGIQQCDPCTANPLFVSDLAQFGWDGALVDTGYYGYGPTAHLTRLRVRYSADTAVEDLDFQPVGPTALEQIRYIHDDPWVVDQFPACDAVIVPPMGDPDVTLVGQGQCGCSTQDGAEATLAAIAGVGALARRRRARRV